MVKLSKNMKSLINTAFFVKQSLNYWGLDFIRLYIRKLKDTISDIPLSFDHDLYSKNLYDWIERADPELKTFLQFNQLFESERSKTTIISQLKKSKQKILDELKDEFQNVPYDPVSKGSWNDPKLVYAHENDDSFEYWFAVSARKEYNYPLEKDMLPEEVVPKIEEIIRSANPDFESLTELVAKYNIFQRVINVVHLSKEDGRLLLSTDYNRVINPDEEDKQKDFPESRISKVFEKAISQITKSAGPEVIEDVSRNKLINAYSLSKLTPDTASDFFIIPYKHEHSCNTKGTDEKNTNQCISINEGDLRRKGIEFYKTRGTLEGFLTEYPEFDVVHSGTLIKVIANTVGSNAKATGLIFGIINDKGHLEIYKVFVNSAQCSVRISYEKGGSLKERLHAELDKFFSKT